MRKCDFHQSNMAEEAVANGQEEGKRAETERPGKGHPREESIQLATASQDFQEASRKLLDNLGRKDEPYLDQISSYSTHGHASREEVFGHQVPSDADSGQWDGATKECNSGDARLGQEAREVFKSLAIAHGLATLLLKHKCSNSCNNLP